MTTPPKIPQRAYLPARRKAHVLKLLHRSSGLGLYVNYSRFNDGRPAELFITAKKPTTLLSHTLQDAAMCISIALQHGVPLAAFRGAMLRDEDGVTPASHIGLALDAVADES